MDKMDLLPGQQWRQEIPRALQTSDFILLFFSLNSTTKRGYVQVEFKLALDTLQEMPEGRIHTIPVRLDKSVDIPSEFGHLHWCNLYDEDGFDKLAQALQLGISQRLQMKLARPSNDLASKECYIPRELSPDHIQQKPHELLISTTQQGKITEFPQITHKALRKRGIPIWDALTSALNFNGMRLLIIGADTVGKTRLANYLIYGPSSESESYYRTASINRINGCQLELGKLTLHIKEIIDTPGGIRDWRFVYDRANIVWYLLRADKLVSGDAIIESLVRKDLKRLERLLLRNQHRPIFCVVGTHCDLDPEFQKLSNEDYTNEFWNMLIKREIMPIMFYPFHINLVLGSLIDKKRANELISRLILKTFM
jgi:GTPase SAR1 family protein